MTTINQLSEATTLQSGDQVPIASLANGDTRRASLTSLSAFIATQISVGDGKITQYAAPLTGGTVTLPANTQNTWLVITPAGTIAALTIILPDGALAAHNQEILVFCSQIVTALTLTAANATVLGAPTAFTANGFFTLRFEGVLDRWYRVA